MTAVKKKKTTTTTMILGDRSGSIDPGVVASSGRV